MVKMEVKKISDICLKVCSGGTPTTSVASYYDGDIPWLNTNEVNFCNIYSTAKHISEEGLRKSAAKYIPINTIIVAMYGVTAGKCAIAKIPLTTNQACCNLIIDETKAHYQYVYYFLKLQSDFLNSLATGGAQQNLNALMIKRFPIFLPLLHVQQKIASILSSYDTLIDINTKRIKLLEESARELYKEWFVRMRFPGYEQAKFVKGIPEGWKYLRIDDIADLSAGGDKPKEFSEFMSDDNKIPVFSNGVANDGLQGYTRNARVLTESVTVSARGTIGFVRLREEPYVPIVRLVVLIPKREVVSPKFLYHLIESLPILGTGASQEQLTVPDFSKVKAWIPLKNLIDKFSIIVEPIYCEIKNLRNTNQTLAATRDRLLPRLLSGELKVKA